MRLIVRRHVGKLWRGSRGTAGTNDDITGVQLPGAFAFTFTGMEAPHAYGSELNGIGIIPGVDVALSQQAFAAGEDPELLAASTCS